MLTRITARSRSIMSGLSLEFSRMSDRMSTACGTSFLNTWGGGGEANNAKQRARSDWRPGRVPSVVQLCEVPADGYGLKRRERPKLTFA